jgi:shikimate dehydrogenase
MMEPLRFALLGHPVGHSVSPAIHEAAYLSLGLPHRYELIDADGEAAVRRCLDLLRQGQFAGLNVTVPWKRLALELSDRKDPLAQEVGAANVLVREADGALAAYNTDVLALCEELGSRAPALRSVSIIGSGGAALAAFAAARKLGATELAVIARSFRAEAPASGWPRASQFRALGAELLAWPDPERPETMALWKQRAIRSQILIQATSAGMQGADSGHDLAALVPWRELAPGTLAYDVVYNPPETPFLSLAHAAGVTALGGLGMLVGQAARAFELWLGLLAPRAQMEEAARRALRDRAHP